ncbi:hypothetical protein V1525DRAFT_400490 [Lipomyces kononenkoae]|uniref:Uncharacterized protein n=1 Tax=Lipomyces kononenkoae TaxID=34357 RepID=A0ACC3T3V6_LIPKO
MATHSPEEGPNCYNHGGFHPAHLGDVYNGRYEVLKKLGYGRYSTGSPKPKVDWNTEQRK